MEKRRRKHTGKRAGGACRKLAAWCIILLLAAGLAACGMQDASEGENAVSGENAGDGDVETSTGTKESSEDSDSSESQDTSSTLGVPSIEWRLAEPVYEKDDDVVYGLSITDFGIEPGSGEDITNKLQAALFLLRNEGGGTLYLPAGEYVLEGTIIVPKGVTICGDWKEPTEEDKSVGGTVLLIYAGRGSSSGTAQFILQPNSCIRDLTIYYPEQTVDDIQPYPATIQLYDPSVWGADYTHVRNVTLVNSYIGIVQGPSGNGCPNVHNLYATTLSMGLSMDGSADVGRCDYITLSADYWIESGYFGEQDEENLRSYLYENAVGLSIGRVDWSYYTNTYVEGYAIGMLLREGELTEMGNYPNGQVYRHTYENCAIGLKVEGVSTAGEEFAEMQIINCDIGIYVTANSDTESGQLQFYRTEISAQTYALLHEGEEDVSFLDCTVSQGKVSATKAMLLLAGCDVQDVSGSLVIRTDDVDLSSVDTAPDMDTPAHKVARSVLYVYDREPSDEEDQSTYIQALLDEAYRDGGGIVFLPPGEYCICGNLTIPEGVELKGSVDVGRNPIRLGTILRVREGADVDSATVLLEANSGISGIVFDYPEQDFADPTLYPYALRGDGENIFIVNVSLRGAYNGVDLMTNRCDNHYVEYLSGICLQNAIQVGGGSTGGKIYNYQMNYIIITAGEESKFGSWDNSPTGDEEESIEAAFEKYLQENLVVLRVGDVTDELLYDNFSYNGYRGIEFVEENGNGASGWCIGQGVDYSTVAIDIQALGNMDFINSQLVSYINSGTEVDTVCHILMQAAETTAQFINVACWARPSTSNLYVTAGSLNVGNLHVYNVPNVSVIAQSGTDVSVINATYWNTTDFYLANGNQGSVTVQGMSYSSAVYGLENVEAKNVRNRNERVDVPENVLLSGGTVVMAESFTEHPAMDGENSYLEESGNFDEFKSPTADAYVGLLEEDGNYYAQLYCNEKASSTYLKSNSLTLEDGKVYELEMRFYIDSINQKADYGLVCSAEGMGAGGSMGTELLFGCYGDYSFTVRGETLTTWEEDTWYRIQIIFDLESSSKSFTVRLLDDDGNVLADSTQMLRSALQGAAYLGGLQIAMTGSMITGSGENDMLLDYCIVMEK